MNKIYFLLKAQDYEIILKLIKSEISTFEQIYKDKKYLEETHTSAKEILKWLYQERDEYVGKSKFYRTLYKKSQICE